MFLFVLKPDKGILKLQRVEQFRIEHTMNTTSFFALLCERFESWKFFMTFESKKNPYFERRRAGARNFGHIGPHCCIKGAPV